MDISRITQSIDMEHVDTSINPSKLKDVGIELKKIGSEGKEITKNGDYDKKELDDLIHKANKVLENNSSHLKFTIHEKTHDVMVKIVNDVTGEVLKEIPPEKIIDMIAKMCENAGVFLNTKK